MTTRYDIYSLIVHLIFSISGNFLVQAIEVASNKKLKKSSKSKETEISTEISTTTQLTASAKSTKLDTATKGSSQVDTPISDLPSHSGGGGKSSTAGPETTAADGEASVQATRKRKHDTDEG